VSGEPRRFDPSEIRTPGEPESSAVEMASALAAARELEALEASDGIRPTEDFADRVMRAVATRPTPSVVTRPASGVRGGLAAALLLAVRDAWSVATTAGRPMAMRAQALAFVVLVVVAVGSFATVGAITVGGLLTQTSGRPPSFEPTPVAPVPTDTALPSPTGEPSGSTQPSGPPAPGVTANPGAAGETASPGSSEHPASTPNSIETPLPTRTPRPTDTPRPTGTLPPTETPDPSDDGGGGSAIPSPG
jgi:hypothetical protein